MVVSHSYKYEWARYIAQQKLNTNFHTLRAKLSDTIEVSPEARNLSELARSAIDDPSVNLDKIGLTPEDPSKFKVGIIGAGCAGLFTALLLDWLNDSISDLDISYDILEAAGPERLGGRLYTHKFSDAKHDYYDVGAMRFPDNDIMKRTFRLFDYIGIQKNLVKYYFTGTNCPSYYNDIRKVVIPPDTKDPYNINSGLPPQDKVPDDLLIEEPDKVLKKALQDFLEPIEQEFAQRHDGKPNDKLWELLMKADQMSVREFLRSTNNPGLPSGPGFKFNTIEWLETFTLATGWYNQSLTETVVDILDFDVDESAGKSAWCIDGGTQRVATLMAANLKKKQPEFHKRVVAIDAHTNVNTKHLSKDTPSPPMTLTIQHKENANEIRDYTAIFNSTTLGALQRMDLTKAGLLYGTKQAIRSLGYGASCKVGMKFRTPWWRTKFNISEGGLAKTDLPLRVCVYPSYNINDPVDEPAVLLCSYTWAQDAQRIGTLISEKSPHGETQLRQVLFHNLALLHADEYNSYEDMMKLLEDQYIMHHAYDWYADDNMSGAFAYFGPGQFSNMWPEITKPNSFGRLYLIGEAASAHHAWIVGALESSVWGVYQMFKNLHLANEKFEPYKRAMALLTEDDPDGKLPFHPLPPEMPRTQEGTSEKDKLTDQLEEGTRLTFAAAQVVLGFMESFIELLQPEDLVRTEEPVYA